MSSKLDKSLDEIAGARRNTRRVRARKPAPVAGGITKAPAGRAKATKPTAPAAKAAATLPPKGESKIAVSNLPEDVTDEQIKEYFSTTVGQVKRVIMNYRQNGRSAGSGTIIFRDAKSAAEAAKTYNGVLVDKRPMRIEVLLGAQHVPQAPPPKGLKDRIANGPKKATAKPKATATGKPANANANANAKGAATEKGGRKAGRVRRPRKTAEQLDADMADYFEPNGTANGTSGAAAPAAPATNGGETAMVEDEIM